MLAKVLAFPMAAELHQPFPSDRETERTGVSKCTSCLDPVDPTTYFALETLCERCDASESHPYSGGQPSGFRPYDREDVRAEIARRG